MIEIIPVNHVAHNCLSIVITFVKLLCGNLQKNSTWYSETLNSCSELAVLLGLCFSSSFPLCVSSHLDI